MHLLKFSTRIRVPFTWSQNGSLFTLSLQSISVPHSTSVFEDSCDSQTHRQLFSASVEHFLREGKTMLVVHFSEKEGVPCEMKRVAVKTKQNHKTCQSGNSVVISGLLLYHEDWYCEGVYQVVLNMILGVRQTLQFSCFLQCLLFRLFHKISEIFHSI